MLAIKNIFAQDGASSTLLFDEIDAGISGETGKLWGKNLKTSQVFRKFCVSLIFPQVAAFGDNFIKCFKN